MTEQAKGERCVYPNCADMKPWTHMYRPEHCRHEPHERCHPLTPPTPPPAPKPANAERCDGDCDACKEIAEHENQVAHLRRKYPTCGKRKPAPGPAKGGEARVEYAEGMMYPWRVIQGLEEDGETPNCVASLREKSVAEFVTGLINERAQLRAANEALREGLRDLANGVLRIGWDRTADHVHEQAVQVIAQLDSDAERGGGL
jgi:hypothetical protein